MDPLYFVFVLFFYHLPHLFPQNAWSRLTSHSCYNWNSVSVHLPSTHHAEYYLHEAKRMKHRADAMVSPWTFIKYDYQQRNTPNILGNTIICFLTYGKLGKSLISMCSVGKQTKLYLHVTFVSREDTMCSTEKQVYILYTEYVNIMPWSARSHMSTDQTFLIGSYWISKLV